MAEENIPESKRCSNCGMTHPLEQFALQRQKKSDGRHSWCKACAIVNARKYREIWKVRGAESWRSRKWRFVAEDDYVRASLCRWKIKRDFGLELDEYFEMVERQEGRCAVCLKSQTGKNYAIDHCHETGKVRGLLCSPCNLAIGQLGDTVEAVERALAYLKAA